MKMTTWKILLILSLLLPSFFIYVPVCAASTEYVYLLGGGESMFPTIREGDTVKVKVCRNGTLIKAGYYNSSQPGDIIVYGVIAAIAYVPRPKCMWICHRAVDKYNRNGTWYFKTKGDNNPDIDPWEVSERYILGVVVEVTSDRIIQIEPLEVSNEKANASFMPWGEVIIAGSAFTGLVLALVLGRRNMFRTCYCVDCGFYVGQYDVCSRIVDGRRVVLQEPRFSEGFCLGEDMLIKDGFRRRKCKYFEQLRKDLPINRYVPLVKNRLKKKEFQNEIILLLSTLGCAITSGVLLVIITDLGAIPPPF